MFPIDTISAFHVRALLDLLMNHRYFATVIAALMSAKYKTIQN